MKKKKTLYRLCATVLVLAALVTSALAAGKTIAEQMAENSAAWWIAHDAGDKELCDKLHKANEELAKQAAGSGGTTAYDEDKGSWTITDTKGNTTSSTSTENGKSNKVTYATTSGSGKVNSYSSTTFSEESIAAMLAAGGTNNTLQTGYNNAAAQATANDAYGDQYNKTSAAEEINVVKQLLGLTNQEAAALQRELEVQKQAYNQAQAQYKAALARGNTATAAAAKQRMDNAHNAAQEVRAKYNYTADQDSATDGGYYSGDGGSGGGGQTRTGDGGGFSYVPLTRTITVTCGTGGSVSPAPVNGIITVSNGTDQKVEFKPDTGYKVKSVKVDGVEKGVITSYTFQKVTAAHTLAVTFEKQKYDISASASAGGSISPSGTQSVEYGGSKTFAITPSTGYEVQAVYVDGVNQGRIGSYTFTNVTSAHSIQATFTKKTYAITATAGSGGSISPSGTQSVEYGSSKVFTITPNTGYEVQAVYVDGVNQGRINSYTFNSVTTAHSIQATFVKKTYAITATAGSGGSISPSGTQSVEYGGSKTFTVTPNTGYEVLAVYVDGVNQGRISSYTFSNITAAHSIRAEFRLKSRLELGSPVFNDASGADLSGTTVKSGYGIYVSCPVTAVNVTGVQLVLSYNFGDGSKQITLQEVSAGSYALPVNSSSATGARCLYIPVGTKDGKYTLTLTLSGLDADGKPITSSSSAAITVQGSMYEDDFTGDR